MTVSLKIFLSLLLVSVITSNAYSQADTTKVKRIDNEINTIKSTNQLKATSQNNSINSNNQIDLNISKQLNTEAINNQLNKAKPNNNSNFLLQNLPEDRDIIGKKYFNNKEQLNVDSNNVNADPLFNADYSLKDGSPAIDAGTVDEYASDIDLTRNDIGVYGGSWNIGQYDVQRAPGATGPFIYPVLDAQAGIANGELKLKLISYPRLK